jgi:hypothetical protein
VLPLSEARPTADRARCGRGDVRSPREAVAGGAATAVLREAQFPIAAIAALGGDEVERAAALPEELPDAWIELTGDPKGITMLSSADDGIG